jgi:hypothetical protein
MVWFPWWLWSSSVTADDPAMTVVIKTGGAADGMPRFGGA